MGHAPSFIRQFYDSPSTFLWEDELGDGTESGRGKGVSRATV